MLFFQILFRKIAKKYPKFGILLFDSAEFRVFLVILRSFKDLDGLTTTSLCSTSALCILAASRTSRSVVAAAI